MTYTLPPLNALRAFEAAARHLSFKLAAHELHVTPAAVGQQVKSLEVRLGVRLFERLHKQLVLTAAGQAFLPEISDGFRRIADATARLKPAGAARLQLGVHGSFDLRRLELAEFRAAHAESSARAPSRPRGVSHAILASSSGFYVGGRSARQRRSICTNRVSAGASSPGGSGCRGSPGISSMRWPSCSMAFGMRRTTRR